MYSIEKEFNVLRSSENYRDLGWFFWNKFMSLGTGTKRRKIVNKLWDSMSRKEKKYCEGI